MEKKLLIVGGDSFIGKNLAALWENKKQLLKTSRKKKELPKNILYLNLLDENWAHFKQYYYHAIIICAGITSISECENNPEYTNKINVENLWKFVKLLRKNTEYTLYLSSNEVFDGSKPLRTKDDCTCPISEYGKQKVKMEKKIATLGSYGILRLTKIIDLENGIFKFWKKSLDTNHEIKAFGNVYISPLNVKKVVKKIDQLVNLREHGITHFSGRQDITYYKFARKMALKLNYNPQLVLKINKSGKFPKYSSLKNNQ